MRGNETPHPNNKPILLVSTVRNEGHWIRDWLKYYKYIGIDYAIIFLHRCSDNTLDILRQFEWVLPLPSSDDVTQIYDWNQLQNVRRAFVINYLLKAEWLLHVDVDELIYLDGLQKNVLSHALSNLQESVSQVIFPVCEVCPLDNGVSDPFVECSYFRKDSTIARPFLDPWSGQIQTNKSLYGHTRGKACVRIRNLFDVRTAHRFKTKPHVKSIEMGRLFHYYICSFDHWVNKFLGKFGYSPDVKIPNVRKRIWFNLINTPRQDPEYLRSYFKTYIAFSEEELATYLKDGLICKQTDVKKVITLLRQQDHQAAKTVNLTEPNVYDRIVNSLLRYPSLKLSPHLPDSIHRLENSRSPTTALKKAIFLSRFGSRLEAFYHAGQAGSVTVRHRSVGQRTNDRACIQLFCDSYRWGVRTSPVLAVTWAVSAFIFNGALYPFSLCLRTFFKKIINRTFGH